MFIRTTLAWDASDVSSLIMSQIEKAPTPTGDPQDIHDRGDGTLIYPLDASDNRR